MSAIEIFLDKFITEGGYLLTLEGLKNTVIIAVCGVVIGFLLGAIVSVVKLIPTESFGIKILKGACAGYVTFLRGTPLLVQLLLCHFALFPAIGLNINSVAEAVLVFGLNSSAYMSEALRSGINAVDKGQSEAGRALGFSFSATMIKIVLPQAVKNILPTIGNEFIALIKETSVVSFIAVTDLTRSFDALANSTYEYFVPYIVLALIYLALVTLIARLVRIMERRLANDR